MLFDRFNVIKNDLFIKKVIIVFENLQAYAVNLFRKELAKNKDGITPSRYQKIEYEMDQLLMKLLGPEYFFCIFWLSVFFSVISEEENPYLDEENDKKNKTTFPNFTNNIKNLDVNEVKSFLKIALAPKKDEDEDESDFLTGKNGFNVHSNRARLLNVDFYVFRNIPNLEINKKNYYVLWIMINFMTNTLWNLMITEAYLKNIKTLLAFAKNNKYFFIKFFGKLAKKLINDLIESKIVDIRQLRFKKTNIYKGKKYHTPAFKYPYTFVSSYFRTFLEKYKSSFFRVFPENSFVAFPSDHPFCERRGVHVVGELYQKFFFKNISFSHEIIQTSVLKSISELLNKERQCRLIFLINGPSINFFKDTIKKLKFFSSRPLINYFNSTFDKYKLWNLMVPSQRQNLLRIFDFYKENSRNIEHYFFYDYRGRFYMFLSKFALYWKKNVNWKKKKKVAGTEFSRLIDRSYYGSRFARQVIKIDYKNETPLNEKSMIYIAVIIKNIKAKLLSCEADISTLYPKHWSTWLNNNFTPKNNIIKMDGYSILQTRKILRRDIHDTLNLISANSNNLERLGKKKLELLVLLVKLDHILYTNTTEAIWCDIKACSVVVASSIVNDPILRDFSNIAQKGSLLDISPDPYTQVGAVILNKVLNNLDSSLTIEERAFFSGLVDRKFMKFFISNTLIGRSIMPMIRDWEQKEEVNPLYREIFIVFISSWIEEVRRFFASYFVAINIVKRAVQLHFEDSKPGPFTFKLGDIEIHIPGIPIKVPHSAFFNTFHVKLSKNNGDDFRVTPMYQLTDCLFDKAFEVKGKKIPLRNINWVASLVQHSVDSIIARKVVSRFIEEHNEPVLTIHDSYYVRINEIDRLNLYTKEALIDVNKEFAKEIRRIVKVYKISEKTVPGFDDYYNENVASCFGTYTKKQVVLNKNPVSLFSLF